MRRRMTDGRFYLLRKVPTQKACVLSKGKCNSKLYFQRRQISERKGNIAETTEFALKDDSMKMMFMQNFVKRSPHRASPNMV